MELFANYLKGLSNARIKHLLKYSVDYPSYYTAFEHSDNRIMITLSEPGPHYLLLRTNMAAELFVFLVSTQKILVSFLEQVISYSRSIYLLFLRSFGKMLN
jgi:hypothetical protein